jgi:hypothetical protein
MPRVSLDRVIVDDAFGFGWLIDFEAENKQQYGHFGEPIPGDQVYLHAAFAIEKGAVVHIAFP